MESTVPPATLQLSFLIKKADYTFGATRDDNVRMKRYEKHPQYFIISETASDLHAADSLVLISVVLLTSLK